MSISYRKLVNFQIYGNCFVWFQLLGNCTCNEGYAGSDCSFDLLGPPTISHVSDFGFCDKSHESCEEITLFGKYFIENMNTNCFMTRHTVISYFQFIHSFMIKTHYNLFFFKWLYLYLYWYCYFSWEKMETLCRSLIMWLV